MPTVLGSLIAIAIAAGIAIPTWFGRPAVTLDNAAILLARDLRAVQNRAAFLGVTATMDFDGDGWRAVDELGQPLTRIGGGEPIERRLSVNAVFDGVRLENIALGADHSIAFDALGRSSEGGSIELTFRGQRRTLFISAPGGQIRIEGLAHAWKEENH